MKTRAVVAVATLAVISGLSSATVVLGAESSSSVVVPRGEVGRAGTRVEVRHVDHEDVDEVEEVQEHNDDGDDDEAMEMSNVDSSSSDDRVAMTSTSMVPPPASSGGCHDDQCHSDDSSHAHGDAADGGHHHSGPVLDKINETAIIQAHGVTPVSYLYYDWVLSPAEVLEVSLAYAATNTHGGMVERHGDDDADDSDESHFHEQHSEPPSDDSLSHPLLMLIHVISFTLAFFVFLPLSLALKAAKVVYTRDDASGVRFLHAPGAIKLVSDVGYWVGLGVGWVSGTMYKSKTPALYQGHVHNSSGNILLLVILAISAVDILHLVRRLVAFVRLPSDSRDVESFNDIVLRGLGESASSPSSSSSRGVVMRGGHVVPATHVDENYRLVHEPKAPHDEDEDEVDLLPSTNDYTDRHNANNEVIFSAPWSESPDVTSAEEEHGRGHFNSRHVRILDTNPTSHRMSRLSNASDSTLRDSASPSGSFDHHDGKKRLMKASDFEDLDHALEDEKELRRPRASVRDIVAGVAKYFMIFVNRGIIISAFVVAVIGICVYTGVGRGNYINGLAAHVIKGSIFFW